jgi:serine/threonine protein kinase
LTHYPQQFGSYVLLEHLGSGGMSQVDLAQRAVAEGAYVRFVVIKRIHTKNEGSDRHIVMFQDEARIHSELHHTNIAQLYDFGEEGDSFYLVMEYVPGMDLRSVQKSMMHRHRKRIPIRVSLCFIADVLEGLAYAHDAVDTLGRPMNVVHRDVNPRNVMLSVSGDVKLIDFGVAKAEDKIDTTRTNALKGKIAYMAPEQMENQTVDGRADLFAVGLMFQEFINGTSPFVGLNEIQIMKRVLDGKLGELNPKGHPDPELLVTIRNQALATDPQERYQKAAHFLRDIDRALEPLGGRMSRAEMAAFVRQVDPVVVARIEQRLTSYRSGDLPELNLQDTSSAPLILDGSMSETIGSLRVQGGASQTQVMAAAAGGAASVVLLLGALAAGAYWMTTRGDDEVVVPGEMSSAAETEAVQPNQEAPVPVVEPRLEEQIADVKPALKVVNPSVDESKLPRAPSEVFVPDVVEDPVVVPAPAEPLDDVSTQISGATNDEGEATFAPEPAESTVVEKTRIFVDSTPRGLEVFVDGVLIGVTPKSPRVALGTRVIEVRHSGTGESQSKTIDVTRSKKNHLMLEF